MKTKSYKAQASKNSIAALTHQSKHAGREHVPQQAGAHAGLSFIREVQPLEQLPRLAKSNARHAAIGNISDITTKSLLRILHLESNAADAASIQSTLKVEGIDCVITRVQNRGDFLAALESDGIDLILSAYSVPGIDGLQAMAIARDRWPELPFILVSGTLGEELAIEAMKMGATDYVLKGCLARLGPALRRAILEVEEHIERVRLEAQFIEAQKMEGIGHLAGGVAHDFNNILSVIMGYNEFVTHSLPADSPARVYAQEIQHASERAASLTRQLLVLSHKQTVEQIAFDLNDTVNELDGMLRRMIGDRIEMTTISKAPTGRIKADPGYVGQVLVNLVVNARDAMPAGGKLTISTSKVALGGAASANYVMLSVSDTGVGMTEEVRSHLFEAFFTTKGKGTGLGLATCNTIVKQSGGHISVWSEEGKGTTVKVYFPRVEDEVEAPVKLVPGGPLAGGTETVLLVEDDPSVRHLARRILEAEGYAILCASNGYDALRVAREHRGTPIRLVVTDVIMPLMDGKIMADWMKATYPDLQFLFTSGYTDNAIAESGFLDSGVSFLQKPYLPAVLTRKVRELLGAAKI